MRTAALFALSLALAGCSDSFGLGDTIALAAARHRWQEAGITEYQVDIRVTCFCLPSGWYRIQVQDNQVVSAVSLPGPSLPPTPPLDAFSTVDEVFDQIQIQVQGGDGNAMLVDATYDDRLGYPHKVTVTCRERIPDCGVTYEIKNLDPLVPLERRAAARTSH
jgi:hypothetical protein